jgi:hypothetical protein
MSSRYGGRVRNWPWLVRATIEKSVAKREDARTRSLTRAAGSTPVLGGSAGRALAHAGTINAIETAVATCIAEIVTGEAEQYALEAGDGGASASLKLREAARAVIELKGARQHDITTFERSLGSLMRQVAAAVPASRGDPIATFEAPLISVVARPEDLITTTLKQILSWWPKDFKSKRPGAVIARQIGERMARASRSTLEVILDKPERIEWPMSGESGVELVDRYVGDTPFEALLKTPVPVAIADTDWRTHAWCIGRPGWGKTAGALELLISRLIERPENNSLVIVDSQGSTSLLDKITRLKTFQPGGRHHGRLVVVNPRDIELPVRCSPFEIGKGDGEEGSNAAESLLSFIFADLFDSTMTEAQSLVFKQCVRLVRRIDGGNIRTLIEVLRNPDDFAHDIAQLGPDARDFFENELGSKTYKDRKEEVRRRLQQLLAEPVFARMLGGSGKGLDLAKLLQDGAIVVVDTDKGYLGNQASARLGRLVIGMTLGAIFARTSIPERQRTLTSLIVDEAFEYFNSTSSLTSFLAQARKFSGSLCLAHQGISQIKALDLRNALAGTVGVQLIGGLDITEFRTMAPRLNVSERELMRMEGARPERPQAEFMLKVAGRSATAMKVSIPLGSLGRLPQSTEREWQAVLEDARQRYGSPETAQPAAPQRRATTRSERDVSSGGMQGERELPERAPRRQAAETSDGITGRKVGRSYGTPHLILDLFNDLAALSVAGAPDPTRQRLVVITSSRRSLHLSVTAAGRAHVHYEPSPSPDGLTGPRTPAANRTSSGVGRASSRFLKVASSGTGS